MTPWLRRPTGVLVLAGLLCVLLQGCGDDGSDTATDDTAGTVDLDGRSLVSTEVTGHDLVEGSTVKVTFEDDTMSVIADCNTMSGTYTYESGTLSWASEPGMTMMACDPALMDQDLWLSELFTAGVDVSGEGSDVVVTSDDVMIHFADA